MAKMTYLFPARLPGKRWRYSVWEEGTAVEDGGWYFTNRLEAAEHARRAEMSSGKRYELRDRVHTAAVLAALSGGSDAKADR